MILSESVESAPNPFKQFAEAVQCRTNGIAPYWLIIGGGLGNTAFTRLSMIEAFYGKADVPIGIVIDQLGTYLVLNTIGRAAGHLYLCLGVGDSARDFAPHYRLSAAACAAPGDLPVLAGLPVLADRGPDVFGMRGPTANVTVFEAGMAPQIGGAIVAVQYGLNANLITLMVGIGTILSFVTAPVLWYFLH
jgi:predicted permease